MQSTQIISMNIFVRFNYYLNEIFSAVVRLEIELITECVKNVCWFAKRQNMRNMACGEFDILHRLRTFDYAATEFCAMILSAKGVFYSIFEIMKFRARKHYSNSFNLF